MLLEILILLGAAALAAPLSRRAGLSPVLGYLAAGAIIGPWGLRLIVEVEDIRHVSEFGVVFLLFLLGIEMKPARLWTMRRSVFGLGGAQVGLSGLALAAVAMALGLDLREAVVVGLGLALSSTAMGLQVMAERGELATGHGRGTFAVLLFQDLMVPVLLTLVPLMAEAGLPLGGDLALAAAEGGAAILATIIAGRWLVRPMLRLVAQSRSAEAFTAAALFIVVAAAYAMYAVGLSMALGAFLAGVLLADTEYRHQVEADIEPFRGLLLGLFFLGVGMSIDFGLLVLIWPQAIALTLALLFGKALVVAPLARLFGHSWTESVRMGGLLSQSGEFGFVVFALAATMGVLGDSTAQMLTLLISLSMAATPFAAAGARRLAATLGRRDGDAHAHPSHREGHVIISGFGRVGRTVAMMLEAAGRRYIAFDLDLERVMEARADGRPVYFGDASRPEVLRAAHADTAALMVVTMDDAKAALRAVAQIRMAYPDLAIQARARDLRHASAMSAAGAQSVIPEAAEASLRIGAATLLALDMPREEVSNLADHFRDDNYAALAADTPPQD